MNKTFGTEHFEKGSGVGLRWVYPKNRWIESVLGEKWDAKERAGHQVHSSWSEPPNTSFRSACWTLRRKQTAACAENEWPMWWGNPTPHKARTVLFSWRKEASGQWEFSTHIQNAATWKRPWACIVWLWGVKSGQWVDASGRNWNNVQWGKQMYPLGFV